MHQRRRRGEEWHILDYQIYYQDARVIIQLLEIFQQLDDEARILIIDSWMNSVTDGPFFLPYPPQLFILAKSSQYARATNYHIYSQYTFFGIPPTVEICQKGLLFVETCQQMNGFDYKQDFLATTLKRPHELNQHRYHNFFKKNSGMKRYTVFLHAMKICLDCCCKDLFMVVFSLFIVRSVRTSVISMNL